MRYNPIHHQSGTTSFMPHILEQDQRFSRSILWQMQRRYFETEGVNAWSTNTVPFFVTSNPYIAKAYAQMIFAWLRDLVATNALDTSNPVYIIELGAGSGRFSYHFLTKFFSFFSGSALRHLKIRYVMTDFPEATIRYWQQHPQLRPWVEDGLLDFAYFDAEVHTTLTLLENQQTLSASTIKNPVALIANYFFDGLRQDAFYIERRKLYERRITVQLPDPPPDTTEPQLLKRIKYEFENREISADDYYDDANFNQILRTYQNSLFQTHLLFPIGSLTCLQRLLALSSGRMIVLSADKGHYHSSDFLFQPQVDVVSHGSFSMSVNYDALGQYARLFNGDFLAPPQYYNTTCVCCLLFGGNTKQYLETDQAYQLIIAEEGPVNVHNLTWAIADHARAGALAEILVGLRLSQWDSNVFMVCAEALIQKIDGISSALRLDVVHTLQHIWKNYYHLGEADNVPLVIGKVFYSLRDYGKSIEFIQHALKLYGAQIESLYLLSLCYEQLGKNDRALEVLEQLLIIQPEFEPAQQLRNQIEENQKRR
jgi:tetratricopeptide (TPR) repeat protein